MARPKDGDGARWHPDHNRVYLQGIGNVKVSVHRKVEGRVKTIHGSTLRPPLGAGSFV